jgi:hypothetical protein
VDQPKSRERLRRQPLLHCAGYFGAHALNFDIGRLAQWRQVRDAMRRIRLAIKRVAAERVAHAKA